MALKCLVDLKGLEDYFIVTTNTSGLIESS